MGLAFRGASFGAAVAALLVASPQPSRAEPAQPQSSRADANDVVIAEALFRDGKDLLAKKDYARACPKLAESFHRDSATGTLLALAICHERDGKIASALGAYSDVAARSKAESRVDREKAARAKALELDAKVSRITIQLADGTQKVPGLEIKRNGVVVEAALWETAMPSDGGPQLIEAGAPGRKTWRRQVSLAASEDRQTVVVPPLERFGEGGTVATLGKPGRIDTKTSSADPKGVAMLTPPTGEALDRETAAKVLAPSPATEAPTGLTAFQHLGIASGIAGIVGLGFGGYFTYRALAMNGDAAGGCVDDFCSPAAKEHRLDARSMGDRATISLVGGGVLTVAGFTMYLLGRRSTVATGASVRATCTASNGGIGGVLQGSF